MAALNDFEIKLLNTVRKYNLIYDRSNPLYNVKAATEKAWAAIASELEMVNSKYNHDRKALRVKYRNTKLKVRKYYNEIATNLRMNDEEIEKQSWILQHVTTFQFPNNSSSVTTITPHAPPPDYSEDSKVFEILQTGEQTESPPADEDVNNHDQENSVDDSNSPVCSDLQATPEWNGDNSWQQQSPIASASIDMLESELSNCARERSSLETNSSKRHLPYKTRSSNFKTKAERIRSKYNNVTENQTNKQVLKLLKELNTKLDSTQSQNYPSAQSDPDGDRAFCDSILPMFRALPAAVKLDARIECLKVLQRIGTELNSSMSLRNCNQHTDSLYPLPETTGTTTICVVENPKEK